MEQAANSQTGDLVPWAPELEQLIISMGFSREEAREILSSPPIGGRPIVLLPPIVHAAAAASLSLLPEDPRDDSASSSSADLAIATVGIDNNRSDEALGVALPNLDTLFDPLFNDNSWGQNQNLRNLLQGHAASPRAHVMTRSSGRQRGRNGGGDIILPATVLEAVRHFCNYLPRAQTHRAAANLLLDADYEYLEAGWQRDQGGHLLPVVAPTTSAGTGSGSTAPVPETSVALEGVMGQALGAFLPASVTAYPVLKEAPDQVKFAVVGGLASIILCLFAGILSRTVARRRLAMRLVSLLAVSVLTFSVASQMSGPTYITLTAFVGVVVNLLLILIGLR